MRICKKCKKEYPETTKYFYTNKNGKNGLTGKCKKCIRKYVRQWKRDNKKWVMDRANDRMNKK